MTSCAGICTFHPRNRQCIISLSAPLLKLRPRKDLVETLLHEMIHGYLFLTNNNRDRDGHGPEFCKHMHRINRVAGTKITIYHNFHDEVKLYQQHWWRCNGPCQKRAPYFGTVRRAMNRAPGPTDFWWKEHQQICGGQFIKIKEPENFKAKSSNNKQKIKSKNDNLSNNIFNWLSKSSPSTKPLSTSIPKNIKSDNHINNQNYTNEFQKLGNTTNNVHGWGIGGPKSSSNSQKHSPNKISTNKISNTPKFSSSGVVGGSNTGRSNLLNKLYNIDHNKDMNKNTALKQTINSPINTIRIEKSIANTQSLNEIRKLVKCPICNHFILNDKINEHIDFCLITKNKKRDKNDKKITIKNYDNDNFTKSEIKSNNSSFAQKRKDNSIIFSNKQSKLDEIQNFKKTNCPICTKSFDFININEHIDKCLKTDKQNNNLIILDDIESNRNVNESIISISSTSSDDLSIIENVDHNTKFKENVADIMSHNCLVCNEFIPIGVSLSDHLEDCIGNVFNDDSFLVDYDNNEASNVISEISIEQSKYPCPVCMQLIIESQMNQHLDVCLTIA
ncbi:sprT-like domain-containing protein Spartan isoform X2 [Apis dorsata]|nr:sprT-like domain-containing protein Spartan isoform X2 [Apis dorsata]